jgi:hypothetical protein
MISRLIPIADIRPGAKIVHWRGTDAFVVEQIQPHDSRKLVFTVTTADGRLLSVSAFAHLNVVDPENT